MKKYLLKFSKQSSKSLNKIDIKVVKIIYQKLEFLSLGLDSKLDIKEMNPKWRGLFRLRVGKYRIIYKKELNNVIILILKIWSRWDIYKS